MNEEFIFIVFFAGLLVIFFIPSIVAFLRGHHYKWIILALNIFGGAFFWHRLDCCAHMGTMAR